LKAEVTMLRDKKGETKIVKKIKTARAVGIDLWRGTTTDVVSVRKTAAETTDEIARVTAIGYLCHEIAVFALCVIVPS
jgi:hypothetical protein